MTDKISTSTKLSNYTLSNLISLDADTLKALAAHFVASHVEAHADMLRDHAMESDEEVPTYQDTVARLQDAKYTVEDYIKDLFADMEFEILRKVKETNIVVHSVTFTKEGFESVDATING